MSSAYAKRWCFTLNNPTDAESESLRASADQYAFLIFGREIGAAGTPHLQGYFELRERKRITGCKKLPGLARAHFEVARGTAGESIAYCSKEDPAPFRSGEPAVPGTVLGGEGNKRRYDEAIAAAKRGCLDEIPSDIRLRYDPTLRRLANDAEWERARENISRVPLVLKEWQAHVLSILEGEPDDRKIHFVLDTEGGAGKTTFCNYLINHDVLGGACQLLHPSRGVDMAYLLKPRKIFLLDCPRSSKDAMPWATIEALKNGHVTSTKYECVEKRMAIPHLIIFCNEMPPTGVLSEDRINIILC